MFGLSLFKRRQVQPDLRVAVLRGLLEARHASRSPQETLQELMRIGDRDLRPEGWVDPKAPKATEAKPPQDAGLGELETEHLVKLLESQEEDESA